MLNLVGHQNWEFELLTLAVGALSRSISCAIVDHHSELTGNSKKLCLTVDKAQSERRSWLSRASVFTPDRWRYSFQEILRHFPTLCVGASSRREKVCSLREPCPQGIFFKYCSLKKEFQTIHWTKRKTKRKICVNEHLVSRFWSSQVKRRGKFHKQSILWMQNFNRLCSRGLVLGKMS